MITPRAPLTIPEGGTAATTGPGALVNLDVPMGTVERVNAGAGLTGGGDIGAVDLAIDAPLSLALGGTGALNAIQARTNLGAAALASPQFTGVPRATGATAPTTDNSDRIATTAFVQAALAAGGGGGGLPDAPTTNGPWARQTGAWVDISNMPISGGTF